ncbi:MAG: succinate dehydrogenase, cytochrome b556 subunit [Candidatus Kuenenia sp.]|nr:succinate dehydrogenase, cytochrome b556 subunit [Candidatus Kuenenia hertensis]
MIIQKLKENLYDLRKNKNIGMFAFWIHRISGVLLTIFLFLHIWTLSAVFRGKDAYDYAISKFDTDLGYIFQYILLLTIAFHLLNGIRITITDFCKLTRNQKHMLRLSLFILFIIAVIGFYTVIL